jgi:hypothetical protein
MMSADDADSSGRPPTSKTDQNIYLRLYEFPMNIALGLCVAQMINYISILNGKLYIYNLPDIFLF